jgi:DNA-binding NarL/FixJ family response regulator/Tfp pilus assembly protein PilZ
MKSVLIVDSDPAMLEIIAGLLRDHGTYFRIMKVESRAKALKIIDRIQMDMVITGLRIPEADTVNLLEQLKQHYPKIKTVVLTDVISPAMQSRINAIGVAAYIEEPVDMDRLTELILAELAIGYGGRLRGISLSSFTQMLELEGASCVLQLRENTKFGRLFFKDGNLIAAETNTLKAQQAAVEILGWENVQIDIDYSPFEKQKDINSPLMNLLLETHRNQDEKKTAKTEQRVHPRFDCHAKVDFDIHDWSYEGLITNISLGGAYIKTDHPLTVGSDIIVTLASLDKSRLCNVRGQVVRRDTNGVGVQFNELSMYQQQVVNSYLSTAESQKSDE